ncbi:hypothetical protein OOK31_07335 [Streptomyces sp. NBC_00249]|uniref:hypothetical protein n=1 Tax=Streptomyces sp. NBC_00249 TaxID=2975690 RepID=UPI002257B68E|nr:hypothetical protein [Streptomyces sp. NBC_00249]MCX5193705.1 hypothetical protein [Streptomyces sp. NBC_00249]
MTADRELPTLFQYGEEWTSRWLSASAHLDEEFARATAVELTEDRIKALGPSLGVDLVAVARHTRLAVRRTNLRDGLLAVLFAAGAGCLALMVHGVQAGRPEVLGRSLLGLVGAFAASWGLVLVAEHRARVLALKVIAQGGPPPEELAPPLDPGLEERLREQERANVAPYHEDAERTNPFVGSGERFQEQVWHPIDISTPADAPDGGGKLSIIPFDVLDLHAFVEREMGNIAGLEGLRAAHRLYVRGPMTLHAGKDLLPDRLRPPRAVIPEDMVQAGLARPGLGMRTYLCLERVGDSGRVIVCMHLRARLQHPSLTWEVAGYVVPPLRDTFMRVRTLRLDPFGHWWTLFTSTTGAFLPLLCKVPARLLRRLRDNFLRRWDLWYARWVIGKRHVEYDYGATGSIRAEAAVELEHIEFSDSTDALDFLQRLERGVLTATGQFLEAHHVDTRSFEQAQQAITHNNYNFHGSINGPGIYGDRGTLHLPGGGAPPGRLLGG